MAGDENAESHVSNISAPANAAAIRMLSCAGLARATAAASKPKIKTEPESAYDANSSAKNVQPQLEPTVENDHLDPRHSIDPQGDADVAMQDEPMSEVEVKVEDEGTFEGSGTKRPENTDPIVIDLDSDGEVFIKKEVDNTIKIESDDEVSIKREVDNNIIRIESDDESVIFLSENPSMHDTAGADFSGSSKKHSINLDGDEMHSVGQSLKKKKSRRKTGPRARTAQEALFQENERLKARRAARASKKEKRDSSSVKKSTSRKSDRASRKLERKSAKKSGKDKSKKQDVHSYANPGYYISNDVFTNVQVEEEPMPDYTAPTAKNTLISNLEEQIARRSGKKDLHRTKTDMNSLIKRSRLFGLNNMGLGKTVEMIATIIANPPKKVEEREPLDPNILDEESGPLDIKDARGTTLIVVPSSLLHTSLWKILDGNLDITQKQVVLTTYHEVMASCPWPAKEYLDLLKKSAKVPKKGKEGDDESSRLVQFIEDNRDTAGLLHLVHWNRIVLDEAHFIKNASSKTSLACNALLGDYRWALSGTPIMNCLSEFYPYFRFLRHPATEKMTSDEFTNKLCPDWICSKELTDMLLKTMIRRVMQDKILGHPIVPLPHPHRKVIKNRFTAAETALYRAVELKFINEMNEDLAKEHFNPGMMKPAGKDIHPDFKNYTYRIAQVTRLRQLAAHPCLMEAGIKIIFTEEELRKLQQDLFKIYQKNPISGLVLHNQLNCWIKEQQEDTKYRAENNKSCLETYAEHQLMGGFDNTTCPAEGCGIKFDINTVKDYTDLNKDKKRSYQSQKKNLKGKDFRLYRVDTNSTPSIWVERADDGKCAWLESTKLLAIQLQIDQLLKNAPGEKIIVFVLWRMFARLIGRYLEKKSIGFVYYTGDMTTNERDKALKLFETEPKVRIMVTGLKCGGLGLNLTTASRVICGDLWWNSCVEQQAFGRVYRIGQKLETHLTRIAAINTIDDRFLDLQHKKNLLVDNALQDVKLTEEELAGLFGRVTRDENGKLFIVPSYDGEDEYDKLGLDETESEGQVEDEPEMQDDFEELEDEIEIQDDDQSEGEYEEVEDEIEIHDDGHQDEQDEVQDIDHISISGSESELDFDDDADDEMIE
ncbi:DNA repair protein rad5 [Phlyctema vagabunda]|uniref:DNA repair protein rad5 n=1 Tax=Phlyctema vagabunda TaxID=108571 RepID=A0ABR4PTE9_9HELO